MDISKFTSDDFDAKTWINTVFSNMDAKADREQFATGMVTKLQVFIQEVAKSLEDINGQIIQTMPKVMRELDAMQQEATMLKGKMKDVQSDVRKIENETVAAMDTLLTIDLAKSRMNEVERALKEVDNWTTLTKDISEVFSSGNPDLIVTRLIGMQQCLTVLGPKVRDYKDRSNYLDQLKDQFVSIVSPSVVAAFASQSLESAQYFTKVFGELGRIDDLEKYYRKSLKADITQRWAELAANDELQDASELMNNFYDYLLSLWFSQLKWCGQMLKSPGAVICRGFTEALSSVDPSVDKVILNRLDTYPSPIAAILTAKLATDNFARSMESSFGGVDAKSVDAFGLLQEIYKPFVSFVLHYQQYEQSQLLLNLDQWDAVEGGWTTLHKIQKSVTPVFAEAFEALERCGTLSDGFASPFLVKAYRTYFTNYLAIVKKFMDSIQTCREDKAIENWDRVQNVLSLTQLCGEMIMNLEKLDETVRLAGEKLAYKIRTLDESAEKRSNTDVSRAYDNVLANNATLRAAVEQFVDKLENSDEQKVKVLFDIGKQIRMINNRVHQLAADLILEPMRSLLQESAKLPVWSASSIGEALTADLPSFSVAPLEYVTKVGQYLMTFAHYLEPYLSQENAAMCTALAECQLPFLDRQNDTLTSEQAVRLWLECAGRGIMASYNDALANIRHLSPSGCKQLLVDVEYLCNVIDDLGLTVDESIKALATLLKMSPEELRDKSVIRGNKFPERYVQMVREATSGKG